MSVMEETLLWKYIDGDCSPEELALVEKMLAEDQGLRQHFERMQALHGDLLNMDLEQPSMRFTTNIMDQLPVLKGTQLLSSRWVLAAAFFLAAIPFLATFFQVPIGIKDEQLPTWWVDINLSLQTFAGAQNWSNLLPWIVPVAALALLFFADRIYQQAEERSFSTQG